MFLILKPSSPSISMAWSSSGTTSPPPAACSDDMASPLDTSNLLSGELFDDKSIEGGPYISLFACSMPPNPCMNMSLL